MNSSIYNADRATYRRIVAIALAISIAITGIMLSSPLLTDSALKATNAGQLHRKAIAAEHAAAPLWRQL